MPPGTKPTGVPIQWSHNNNQLNISSIRDSFPLIKHNSQLINKEIIPIPSHIVQHSTLATSKPILYHLYIPIHT
jgi:hypothetical protein